LTGRRGSVAPIEDAHVVIHGYELRADGQAIHRLGDHVVDLALARGVGLLQLVARAGALDPVSFFFGAANLTAQVLFVPFGERQPRLQLAVDRFD
jgi:hypothetical protein